MIKNISVFISFCITLVFFTGCQPYTSSNQSSTAIAQRNCDSEKDDESNLKKRKDQYLDCLIKGYAKLKKSKEDPRLIADVIANSCHSEKFEVWRSYNNIILGRAICSRLINIDSSDMATKFTDSTEDSFKMKIMELIIKQRTKK